MPSAEELEQLLEVGVMEKHLDPMEISRLHQMGAAARIMDEKDEEADDGNQGAASELGE